MPSASRRARSGISTCGPDHERRGRGTAPFGLVDVVVLPAPAVADDPLEEPPRGRATSAGSIVLVDRHAGRRVRHVDEHCRPAGPLDGARERWSVMSIELGRAARWRRLSSCTAAYPRRPRARSMARPSRELDAFRDDADRFIAELERGVLPPLRRTTRQTLEHRADLRAARGAHASRHRAAARRRTDRALALRLRGLPRRPDPRARRARAAAVEAALETDGRRREDPVPDAPRGDRRTRPTATAARRLETERGCDLLDEHLNPVYLEAHAIDREAVLQLGSPNYYELYKRFGFRLDELQRRVSRAPRRDRVALGDAG